MCNTFQKYSFAMFASACDQIRQIISLIRCDSCEKDSYFTAMLTERKHIKNLDDRKIT